MWLTFTSIHNPIDEELACLIFVDWDFDYLPSEGHGAVVNVCEKCILVVVHITMSSMQIVLKAANVFGVSASVCLLSLSA